MKNFWTTFFCFALANLCLVLDIECQVQNIDYGEDLLALHSAVDARKSLPSSIPAPISMTPIDMLSMAVPGTPGEDYPILAKVPSTSFSCDGDDRVHGGYYADVEADCQPFHICADLGAGVKYKYSFLCPNGTMFSQAYFICDWWFNVDCSASEQFYSLNDEIAGNFDITQLSSAPVEPQPLGTTAFVPPPTFQSSQSQRRQKPYRANTPSSPQSNGLNTYKSNTPPTNFPQNSNFDSYEDGKRNKVENVENINQGSIIRPKNNLPSLKQATTKFAGQNPSNTKDSIGFKTSKSPSSLIDKGFQQRANSNFPSRNVLSRPTNDNKKENNVANRSRLNGISNTRSGETRTTQKYDYKSNSGQRNGSLNTDQRRNQGNNNRLFNEPKKKKQDIRNKQRRKPTSQTSNKSNRNFQPNSNVRGGVTKSREQKTDPTKSSVIPNYGAKLDTSKRNKVVPPTKPKTVFPEQRPHNKAVFNRRRKPKPSKPNSTRFQGSNGNRYNSKGSNNTEQKFGRGRPSPISPIGNKKQSSINKSSPSNRGYKRKQSNYEKQNKQEESGLDRKRPSTRDPGSTSSALPSSVDYENYNDLTSEEYNDYDYGQDNSPIYDDRNSDINGSGSLANQNDKRRKPKPSKKPPIGYGVPLGDPITARAPVNLNEIDGSSNKLPDYDFSDPYSPENNEDFHGRQPPTIYDDRGKNPISVATPSKGVPIDDNSDISEDYDYYSYEQPNLQGTNAASSAPQTGYGASSNGPLEATTSRLPNSPNNNVDSFEYYDYEDSSQASNPLSSTNAIRNNDNQSPKSEESGQFGRPSAKRPSTNYGVPLANPIGPNSSNRPSQSSFDYYDYEDTSQTSNPSSSTNGNRNNNNQPTKSEQSSQFGRPSAKRPSINYGVPLANPIGPNFSSRPGQSTNKFNRFSNDNDNQPSMQSNGNQFPHSTSNVLSGNKLPIRPSSGYGVPLANPIGTEASNFPSRSNTESNLSTNDYESTQSVSNNGNQLPRAESNNLSGNKPGIRPSTAYGVPLANPIRKPFSNIPSQLDTKPNRFANGNDGQPSVSNDGNRLSHSTLNSLSSKAPPISPSTTYGVPLGNPIGTTASGLSNKFKDNTNVIPNKFGERPLKYNNGAQANPSNQPFVDNGSAPEVTNGSINDIVREQQNSDSDKLSNGINRPSFTSTNKALDSPSIIPPTGYGVPLADPISTIKSKQANNIGSHRSSTPSNNGASTPVISNDREKQPAWSPPTIYEAPPSGEHHHFDSNSLTPPNVEHGASPIHDPQTTAPTSGNVFSTSTGLDYSTNGDNESQGNNKPSTGYGVPLQDPIGPTNQPSFSTNSDVDEAYDQLSSQQDYDNYEQDYNTIYDQNEEQVDNGYQNNENIGLTYEPKPTIQPSSNTASDISRPENQDIGNINVNPISQTYGVPVSEPLGPTSSQSSLPQENFLSNLENSKGSSTSHSNNPANGNAPNEDNNVNYVTPHDLPSGHKNNNIPSNPLSTAYGVPLAQPIGPKDSNININHQGNTNKPSNQFFSVSNGNQPSAQTTSSDAKALSKQNAPTFGISSSAVSGTQGTLLTNTIGVSTSNSPPSLEQSTFSQNLPSTISPAIQTFDGGKSNSISSSIPNSTPQNPNYNQGTFPSQFQVIMSLNPFPGALDGQLTPQNQPDINIQPVSSDYTRNPNDGFTSSSLSNSVTPTSIKQSQQGESSEFSSSSGPTVQSSIAETTYDSSLDTYGSPSAGPLSSQTNDIVSNQQSADTSYGAPLGDPLEDSYGAPKAAPIDSSYGAPLAQPVSQLSYGAPKAAPLSRYQSKNNWPPPPPPPPASSVSPFKSFSFGRSKRLQRYRHNFRNRFKRRFPTFHFRG